jgi:uncharacterized protein (DUF302 family)
MVPDNGKGLIDIPSSHSVDETVTKLEGILQAKGITLFALVDHSGEAAKAGMKMRPTKLLIFGNPRAGTPVMLAAPSSAIDLPLKILVWEDDQGKVWRHGTTCRRTYCNTSRSSNHWPRTLRNSERICISNDCTTATKTLNKQRLLLAFRFLSHRVAVSVIDPKVP